jgi:Crp-like helix-turn-helix domain
MAGSKAASRGDSPAGRQEALSAGHGPSGGAGSGAVRAAGLCFGQALPCQRWGSERLLDEGNSDLHQRLYRYTHVLFNQIGQLVVCNRLHLIAQRCARWLLLTHDRMGRGDFLLTHDSLAQMLGVRRASVTEVAGRLQQAGLIRYRRGVIQVLDRAGLEAACCECYGVMQQQYDQLLGPA